MLNKSWRGAVLEDIGHTLRQEQQWETPGHRAAALTTSKGPQKPPTPHPGPCVAQTLRATKTPHRPPPMSWGSQPPGPDTPPEDQGPRSSARAAAYSPLPHGLNLRPWSHPEGARLPKPDTPLPALLSPKPRDWPRGPRELGGEAGGPFVQKVLGS